MLRLFFNALGLFVIAYYIPGITVTGFYPALISAFILGVLNVFLRPILLILTLPITMLTLGLFSFVINAFLFWFVASFIQGFSVDSFAHALIGSLFMSIISVVGGRWISGNTGNAKVIYKELK